uniref:Uncharacterized protein LOC114345293 n=1 Tax=Diabrotica virgifera virgifera TaxID=50390 RepID=A0A6P7H7K8_DIAVI
MFCKFYLLFLVGISPFVLRNHVVTGAPTNGEPSKPEISIDILTILSSAFPSLLSIEGAPEFMSNLGLLTAVNKCVDPKVLANIMASLMDAFQNEEGINQPHVFMLTGKSFLKLHKMLMCVLITMYKEGSLQSLASPLNARLGALTRGYNMVSLANSFNMKDFKDNVDIKALANGNMLDALNGGAVDLNGLSKNINLDTVAKGLQAFF